MAKDKIMDFRKIGFQKTVNFQTSRPINAGDLKSLPHIIYKKTGYNYAFEHTDSGCFIKPSFNRYCNYAFLSHR